MKTPKELGYFFPAEWEKHEATWLTFPHNEESFPGKMKEATDSFMQFVKVLALGEKVRVNINDEVSKQHFLELSEKFGINKANIEIFIHLSDDVWCRDHGPAFLINPDAENGSKKIIIDWEFNAWGGKYPFENDNRIPLQIGEKLSIPVISPGIIMEGGSVEFNGCGTIITSEACLLNINRNNRLSRNEIEKKLTDFYGADQILWVGSGISGDDTDGHIDDMARFVSKDTVITMVEMNNKDENYNHLSFNLQLLKRFRLHDGSKLNIIEIPMPDPVFYNNQRLPASYANFYICNHAVIVPVFSCRKDQTALDIIQKLFPDREIIGIDSTHLVWGFGSFHCLSQQEPFV